KRHPVEPILGPVHLGENGLDMSDYAALLGQRRQWNRLRQDLGIRRRWIVRPRLGLGDQPREAIRQRPTKKVPWQEQRLRSEHGEPSRAELGRQSVLH